MIRNRAVDWHEQYLPGRCVEACSLKWISVLIVPNPQANKCDEFQTGFRSRALLISFTMPGDHEHLIKIDSSPCKDVPKRL